MRPRGFPNMLLTRYVQLLCSQDWNFCNIVNNQASQFINQISLLDFGSSEVALLNKTLICRYWPKKVFGFCVSSYKKYTHTCGVQVNIYFQVVFVHDKFQAYRLQWQLSQSQLHASALCHFCSKQKTAFHDTGALLLNIVMKASYIFWLIDCPDSLSN